jgi:hypothetical protein
MFGKRKRQTITVTFVQPIKGEAYFYAPIAYSTILKKSKETEGKQVFTDPNLALAGKLKLIFEREKMTWFEIKEEKAVAQSKGEHFFALYYYPQRLVARRSPSFEESATLQELQKLFDFFVNEDQTRFAKVQKTQSPSAYGSIAGESSEKAEAIAVVEEEPSEEEPEAIAILAACAKH